MKPFLEGHFHAGHFMVWNNAFSDGHRRSNVKLKDGVSGSATDTCKEWKPLRQLIESTGVRPSWSLPEAPNQSEATTRLHPNRHQAANRTLMSRLNSQERHVDVAREGDGRSLGAPSGLTPHADAAPSNGPVETRPVHPRHFDRSSVKGVDSKRTGSFSTDETTLAGCRFCRRMSAPVLRVDYVIVARRPMCCKRHDAGTAAGGVRSAGHRGKLLDPA